jgi:hydroxyethylthiazole kinase-like uncharacterized protein yjeF
MNLRTAVLDVQQIIDADRLSLVAGLSAFELMAHAGTAVAHAIVARWTPRPLLVLCGPGNNGGDGFVAAQRLAEAGWPVRVAALRTRDDGNGEAHRRAERWQGNVEALDPSVLDGAQLIVDALFGAGLSRPLSGKALETLAMAGDGAAPIIAIDIPSGVMGDTGEVIGAVRAALTVTFLRKKPGHLLLPARDLCGEVVVAELLHGKEKTVHADAGYIGAQKRAPKRGRKWHIAAKRSRVKAMPEDELKEATQHLEYIKAAVRSKVEHPFRVVKRQFGYQKVRFKGLAKNTAQILTLFALSNLWMMRRTLLSLAGEVRP